MTDRPLMDDLESKRVFGVDTETGREFGKMIPLSISRIFGIRPSVSRPFDDDTMKVVINCILCYDFS
jgi:hypothetical protein